MTERDKEKQNLVHYVRICVDEFDDELLDNQTFRERIFAVDWHGMGIMNFETLAAALPKWIEAANDNKPVMKKAA